MRQLDAILFAMYSTAIKRMREWLKPGLGTKLAMHILGPAMGTLGTQFTALCCSYAFDAKLNIKLTLLFCVRKIAIRA